jgi:hypothetical protein
MKLSLHGSGEPTTKRVEMLVEVLVRKRVGSAEDSTLSVMVNHLNRKSKESKPGH